MPMKHRNRSVDVHQFAMVPRSEIPRSSFRMQTRHLTTFNSGWLVPFYVEEILPGDTFNLRATIFTRMATPIFPVMDNLYIETFFFFVPYRLVWSNWKKFNGEQVNPGDSISYTIPQLVSPAGGYGINSLFDYFGLPTAGQVTAGATISHSCLPLRAYNLIYNEWFRDENLVPSQTVNLGDGPDALGSYGQGAGTNPLSRGKRHDYFTSALPWPQKGSAVTLPLTGNATIRTQATDLVTGAQTGMRIIRDTGAAMGQNVTLGTRANPNNMFVGHDAVAGFADDGSWYPSNLYADLSTVTSTTINALRQSFQIQKLLERDARGGTRYTEIVRSHFGVVSPDARLQRPEYLGGGSSPINITPVPQTSNTPVSGTPQGNLAAFATGLGTGHGFTQSFTEHGVVIGIVNVRADLTYQQGLHRFWSRSTRYDFYWPAFAFLGEQSILNKEIYVKGDANDALVFGYQERWAEYRYHPAQISGKFRSTAAGTIDTWHLAQNFTALPTLNATFINEAPPVQRVVAAGAAASGQEFIMDCFIDIKAARPLPLYSVPGMIDRF